MFSTFSSKVLAGYNKLLLRTASIREEITRKAEKHIEFLYFALGEYDKNRSNLAPIIVGSVNTNRAFDRKVGLVFVACNLHKFNITVKDLFLDFGDIVKRFVDLMTEL